MSIVGMITEFSFRNHIRSAKLALGKKKLRFSMAKQNLLPFGIPAILLKVSQLRRSRISFSAQIPDVDEIVTWAFGTMPLPRDDYVPELKGVWEGLDSIRLNTKEWQETNMQLQLQRLDLLALHQVSCHPHDTNHRRGQRICV